MNDTDRKAHWDHIYQTKQPDEVSWYQPVPTTSLEFLKQYDIPLTAKIIDIGGGDSYFVDHLLGMGYRDITVLDISEVAVQRAKARLGEQADQVKWIVEDAATFQPEEKYDFWHDRATFHFLTREPEIDHYIHTVQQSLQPGGILLIGTFSEEGPEKCSGIYIRRYDEASLTGRLKHAFEKIDCFKVDHKTPGGTVQNFIFCSFRKL